jgi:hypothetical protein
MAPALKRWAIVFRPVGLETAVQEREMRPLVGPRLATQRSNAGLRSNVPPGLKPKAAAAATNARPTLARRLMAPPAQPLATLSVRWWATGACAQADSPRRRESPSRPNGGNLLWPSQRSLAQVTRRASFPDAAGGIPTISLEPVQTTQCCRMPPCRNDRPAKSH